jgi:N6-adenosine-specific RNA methylase IME4
VLVGSTEETGRPLPLADESIRQTVFVGEDVIGEEVYAPKQDHSRKPDEVQDRIDSMYPDAHRLEMFARRKRDGWDAWGNEIEGIFLAEMIHLGEYVRS